LKSKTQAEVSWTQAKVNEQEIAQAKESLVQAISYLKQQKEQLVFPAVIVRKR